jgi:hypothetical protein
MNALVGSTAGMLGSSLLSIVTSYAGVSAARSVHQITPSAQVGSHAHTQISLAQCWMDRFQCDFQFTPRLSTVMRLVEGGSLYPTGPLPVDVFFVTMSALMPDQESKTMKRVRSRRYGRKRVREEPTRGPLVRSFADRALVMFNQLTPTPRYLPDDLWIPLAREVMMEAGWTAPKTRTSNRPRLPMQ